MPIEQNSYIVKKVVNGNRSLSLINRKAEEMNMKLESVPFVIDKSENKLGNTLSFSNFLQVRQKLGKLISLNGKAALGFYKYNENEWLIRPLTVLSWEVVGSKEIYLVGTDGSTYDASYLFNDNDEGFDLSGNLTIMSEYSFVNNVPTMKKFVELPEYPADKDTKKFYINEYEQKFFDIDFLPVKLFKNNDSMTDDVIEYGVSGLLEQLNQLSKDYVSIWNMSKSKPYFNENLFDGDPDTATTNIKTGFKDYIFDDSYNSKLGAGIQIMPGNTSPALLEQHIGYITIEIEKQFGLLRDSMLTANQKNIIEILSKDEFAYEKSRIKRLSRQIEYNDFFRKLCLCLKVKIQQPKLQVSKIDNWKEQMLQASIAQLEGSVNKNMVKQPKQKDTNNEIKQ